MKTTGNKYTMLNCGLLHIQLSVTPISQKAPIIWFIQMKTLRPQTSRGATVLTIPPRAPLLEAQCWGGIGTLKWWGLLQADWVTRESHREGECGSVKSRSERAPAFLLFGFLPHHVFPLTWAFHMMPTAMTQCSQRCPLQGWHGVF